MLNLAVVEKSLERAEGRRGEMMTTLRGKEAELEKVKRDKKALGMAKLRAEQKRDNEMKKGRALAERMRILRLEVEKGAVVCVEVGMEVVAYFHGRPGCFGWYPATVTQVMYMCVYARTHTRTRARTHTHTRAHTHTLTHTHTHTHTHAHTHTRTIQSYIHTYIQSYIHTYMRIFSLWLLPSLTHSLPFIPLPLSSA